MTGPEHYREAERLLSLAHRNTYGDANNPIVGAALATEAQAHATLALAAATAMGTSLDGEPDSGLPQRDAEAWYAAAGTKPQKGGDR